MEVNTGLTRDYDECEKIIKKYSKSFYYAFSNLPEPDAKAVYAIYAFCRKADDIVDETPEKARQHKGLETFSKELEEFCDGDIPDDPMWRALDDTCKRYGIDDELFYVQLKGQRMDIDFKQPGMLSELAEYSGHVAGSVGELLTPVLCRDVTSVRLYQARQLGVAMQYTNILRDIGEDYFDYGRIYMPSEIMEKHGYNLEKLKDKVIDQSFINMWESLAKEAEQMYDDFLPELIHYKDEARKPLLLSMKVYREIINEVRRQNYDCLTERQSVSKKRKIKIKRKVEMYLDQMTLG